MWGGGKRCFFWSIFIVTGSVRVRGRVRVRVRFRFVQTGGGSRRGEWGRVLGAGPLPQVAVGVQWELERRDEWRRVPRHSLDRRGLPGAPARDHTRPGAIERYQRCPSTLSWNRNTAIRSNAKATGSDKTSTQKSSGSHAAKPVQRHHLVASSSRIS